MSGEVIIRPGSKPDLPQVLDLIMELAEFTGYSHLVSTTVKDMERDGFGDDPVFGFFVALKDSKIIGTSIYYYRYSTWKGKRLYLEDLVVRESERRGGVGKLLFDATMQKCLDENCSGMMWQVLNWNEKAIDFYKKYGTNFESDFVNCNLEADQIRSFVS